MTRGDILNNDKEVGLSANLLAYNAHVSKCGGLYFCWGRLWLKILFRLIRSCLFDVADLDAICDQNKEYPALF